MATSPPAEPIVPRPPGADLTNAVQALELHDVKPPLNLVNPWSYAVAALLLGLLIAALLFWLLRARRREAPTPAVIVPPHRRASDRLHDALRLIHDPKAFITRVANTLRVYLEERFQLHAPERTTEEFLQELHGCPAFTLRQAELLADFLNRCDLVKFARLEPAEAELRGLWQTAHHLVVETSPSVEGTPGAGEQVVGPTSKRQDQANTTPPKPEPVLGVKPQ